MNFNFIKSKFIWILSFLFITSVSVSTQVSQAATIDVLVAYDRSATSWVNTHGGITAFAEDAINRMNLAAENTNLDLRFHLVHAMSIAYTFRSFNYDLYYLQSGSGAFAEVHAAREQYGADVVSLLVDTGSAYGITGLGNTLSNWSGDPDYAFSVCSIRAVAIDHTLTHEIGHNLGAMHAKNQSVDPGPNWYLNASYAAGWYFTGTDRVAYHTIMAYDSDGYGGRYESAPLFSSPLISYHGTPAGNTRDGDNARLLRETQDIIADYRTAATPTPNVPSAQTASDISNSGFTAHWQTSDYAAGYHLDLATDSTFTNYVRGYQNRDTGNNTSYSFTGLAAGTAYFYRVRAYNSQGTSGSSNTITVTTNPASTPEQYARQVYVMFAGYFGRPPAPAGFNYYTNWMAQTNGNYHIIVDDFFRSTESQSIYGSLSTTEAINQVYQYLFARNAAAGGLAYWQGQIESGKISVAEMAYTVAYSAASSDQLVLAAKIQAAQAFKEQLERVPGCTIDTAYARDFLAGVKSQDDVARVAQQIVSIVGAMCN